MSFPHTILFVSVFLGLGINSWHSRQVSDNLGYKQSIFSENHGYKSFLCVAVNPYVLIL